MKFGFQWLTSYFAIIILSVTLAKNGSASTLKIEWDVEIYSQYNYAEEKLDDFTPIQTYASITFDNVVSSFTDYGTTSVTNFGGVYGTSWVTPMFSQIAEDPFGLGLNTPSPTSYTFPNVSDYSSAFIEEAASQKTIYSPSNDFSKFWNYHVEIRATKIGASRGGAGTADYFFTPDSLIEFYTDFQNSNSVAYFNESYQLFDQTIGKSFGGFSWAGSATIRSITQETIRVTNSTTLFLFLLGVSGVLYTRIRNQDN